MGNFIVISIFAKMSDPEQTFVEANKTIVSRHFCTRDVQMDNVFNYIVLISHRALP